MYDCCCFSNLLRPSGVRLQPATTTVKVYSAEDLPQSLLLLFDDLAV